MSPSGRLTNGLATMSSVGQRHAGALFGASAACRGALLAVRCLVFGTFVATRPADVGAQPANRFGMFAAPRHGAGSKTADGCAIGIQGDAADHHLDVVLLKTGGETAIARCRTRLAGLDAGKHGGIGRIHSALLGMVCSAAAAWNPIVWRLCSGVCRPVAPRRHLK